MIHINQKIAFQGEFGANSDMACRHMYPNLEPLACTSFADVFQSIETDKALYGIIPIENNLAGRVADIYHLLPQSSLHIVGEYFLPIHFQLMANHGTQFADIKSVHSHVHALGQCRKIIKENQWDAVISYDTAGAAKILAQNPNPHQAVLAPQLAAELYGLNILQENVEDASYNATRFIVLSKTPHLLYRSHPDQCIISSFIFRVRNVPAALYKTLGGFATNGVNLTKLESYQLNGSFKATQFYVDIEGHPNDPPVKLALDELSFFSHEVRLLGTYLGDKWRHHSPDLQST